MRCRSCEYPLWTVRARHCPECGEAFRPSDFAYLPKAVQFECPHCATAYPSTLREISLDGHLVPRAFTCTTCQSAIEFDEMIVAPVGPEPVDAESAGTSTWFEDRSTTWLWAWMRATWNLLTNASGFAQGMRRRGDVAAAWAFLIISLLSASIGNAVLNVAVALVVVWTSGDPVGVSGHPAPLMEASIVGTGILVLGLLLSLGLVVWAIVSQHVVVCMLAPRRAGMGGTQRAVLYATGAVLPLTFAAQAVEIAPIVAVAIAILWVWINARLVSFLHRVSFGRGLVIAVSPLVILAMTCFASVALLGVASSGIVPT